MTAFLEPDEALARVQQDIAAAHARAAAATALRTDLDRVRGVASSTGGEVRVEVDPSGRLTDLQIQDAALDRSGRDLARIVLDLVQRAGQDAGRQAVALTAAAFGDGDPITAHLADEVAGRWGAGAGDGAGAGGGPGAGPGDGGTRTSGPSWGTP